MKLHLMFSKILPVFATVIFALGNVGPCTFERNQVEPEVETLEKGFVYNGSDQGFVTNYYFAGGDSGAVFTTDDPVNSSWTRRNSQTSNRINCLRMKRDVYDSAIVFGAGDNGTIIRSLDGGISWTSLNSGVNADLNSIDFTANDLLVAVGDSGVIVRSTDGGNTWAQVNSGTEKGLNSIHHEGFRTMVCGNSGTFMSSSDRGATWQSFPLNDTTTDLNRLGKMGTWFFGTIFGMVGDNGKLYRSTNGFSWTNIALPATVNLYDLQFRNASEGYVCGDSGVVLYTIDGGIQWYSDPFVSQITGARIGSSLLVNDTTALAAAGNEIILIHANESVMPVELISFTSRVSGNDVVLNWSTGTEAGNSGFGIERRRADGTWMNAGFVGGGGNSAEPRHYEFCDRNLPTGIYHYRLKQTDYNGNFEYCELQNLVTIGVPEKFGLEQNYPNPFNPETNIGFRLTQTSNATVSVFDISGRETRILSGKLLEPGYHNILLNASGFPSGIYFCRLSAEGRSDVIKMTIVK